MKSKNYPPGFDVQAAWDRHSREWDQATISNDKLFGLVMGQDKYCHELLRRSLPEERIAKLRKVEAQHQVMTGVNQRTVRFDVYTEAQRGRAFDVEMQVANEGDLPHRMRYYQAMMEYDHLRPREGYRQLAAVPTYVIFYCDFDYYGRGAAMYRFENYERKLKLTMGDDRSLIVFNAKAREFGDRKQLKTFLDLMHGHVDTEDKYIVQVANEVSRLKADEQLKEAYVMDNVDLEFKMYEQSEKIRAEEKQKYGFAIIKELIKQGQSKEKATNFLIQTMGMSKTEADAYYQEAIAG